MDEDGRRLLLGGCRLIGAVLQNGGDGLVGAGVEEKGAGAGGVEALWIGVRTIAVDQFNLSQPLEVLLGYGSQPLIALDGADVTSLPDEMGEDCGVVARTSPHLTNAIPSLDVKLIEEIRPECRRAVIDTFPLVEADQHIVIYPCGMTVGRAPARDAT